MVAGWKTASFGRDRQHHPHLEPCKTQTSKPAILKSPYRIVSHVDFINDGAQILSAGGGDEALVWDAESGEIVTTMPGHGKSARHMQLSGDGKALLTQDFEGVSFASGTPGTGLCSPTHDIASKSAAIRQTLTGRVPSRGHGRETCPPNHPTDSGSASGVPTTNQGRPPGRIQPRWKSARSNSRRRQSSRVGHFRLI